MWRAWMSEGGGLAAGGRLVRRFAFSGRGGSGRKDGFLVDMADTGRAVNRLGRRVGILGVVESRVGTSDVGESSRANAVRPGPPTLTRPRGGSLTSSTPNTITPPGANRSARCFVARRTAAASK